MGKDSSEIRREIEDTRARMGDTVEALAYKSDVPSRVKDAVNERVETVKGSISDVVESVKDTLGGATGKVGSALSSARGQLRETDKLGDVTGKLGDTTSNVRSTVQNTISNTVGQVAGKLPNPSEVKGYARRGAGIAAENPLGLALGALAIGFLAGLVVPVTDLEREKIGPLRDDLVDRAKDIGSDALEHGKQVLQDTAHAALGAAQQSAQQVFSEAKGDAVHGQDTGAPTSSDTGMRSSDYGVLLDDRTDTLRPGSPGTASP
jgi:hypothetical protein